MVTRILEGPRIRQQAIARSFVERFRAMQNESLRDLDWRGWIDRYLELVQWDLDLTAGERDGPARVAARALSRPAPRVRAVHVARLPGLARATSRAIGRRSRSTSSASSCCPVSQQDRAAVFIVIDCLRLDQWQVLEPLIAPLFDIETTHYFGVLPTATPYARNALFSGLFPDEIAARFPDWWGEREDETLNAHERDLLEAQLAELEHARCRCKYDKISSSYEADELERRLANAIAPEGISAFVFNFVDLLTHGRTESAILYEVARDEIALRQLTLQWFKRSALFSVLQEAARRKVKVLVTSDHGSIHCHTPATVFAKRDATQNLRYKFGEDLRAENPEHALLFTNEDALQAAAPRARREHAARHGRQLLRLSHEAARIPEPLSRLVPARRRDAGGVHPAVSLLTPKR